MTPAVAPIRTVEKPNRILLRDVSWEFYRRFIDEVQNQRVRVTYSDGAMEIMSSLPIHEKIKTLVAQMIELLTLELGIPRASLGSTTYQENTLEKGLEPEECYYFANEPRVRGKDCIDLSVDPPPDLAVEVEITHSMVNRQSIYAAMGVPEIWKWDGDGLRCLVLGSDGRYAPSERSRSLPMLRPADLEPFLARINVDDETTIMRAFRDWVRQQFA